MRSNRIGAAIFLLTAFSLKAEVSETVAGSTSKVTVTIPNFIVVNILDQNTNVRFASNKDITVEVNSSVKTQKYYVKYNQKGVITVVFTVYEQ